MAYQPKGVRRATNWNEIVEEGIAINIYIINNNNIL